MVEPELRPRRSAANRKLTLSPPPRPSPPSKKTRGRSKKLAPVVESDDDDEIPATPSDVEEFEESESDESSVNEQDTDEEDDEEEESDSENNDEAPQTKRNKLDIALRFFYKNDIPELYLPESSHDLLLSNKYIFRALGIYESLQRFHYVLRLSPFRFEDFCIILMLDEQSYLLSEIHICLIKALIREDELLGTHYCSQEFRDSLNVYLFLCDHLTWPEVLRIYLAADIQRHSHVIKNLLTHEYPFVSIEKKLELLEFLLEEFMNTVKCRESVNSEGLILHDDHCRACHKGGDLICCESCPATFHLACLDPPLRNIPTESWGCPLCKQNAVTGVTDCKLDPQYGGLSRHEPIGYDRHGRKYWFLSRRIFIEDSREGQEDVLFYYTTRHQFDELLDTIDENNYEEDLYKTLKELEDVIAEQMYITEKLTKSAKGSRKSYIEEVNEELSLKRAHKLRLENADTCDTAEALNTTIDNLETSGGIQTRLRTGTIQPKNSNFDALRNKSSVYNLISSFRDEDYFIVFDDSGHGLTKILKKSITSDYFLTNLFKLGLEGNYKNYQNLFVMNVHSLNKFQQNEERDRKKHLQSRFNMNFDLKWGEYNNVAVQVPQQSQFGNQDALISAVKQALLHLESKIPPLFFHPLWISNKTKWMQAVTMSKIKNFSLAFNILESHLKPIMFTTGFQDLLGFTFLQRSTQLERDELKKKDKKEKGKSVDTNETLGFDSEFSNQGRYGTLGNGVKLIKIKLKHQIWKSRGEEFRLSGVGGWRWNTNLAVPVGDLVHSKPELLHTFNGNNEIQNNDLIDISKDLKSNQRHFYSTYASEDWNVLLEKRLEMLQIEKTNSKASAQNISITTNDSNSNVSDDKPTERRLYSCYSAVCDQKNCYSPLCFSQTQQDASKSQIKPNNTTKFKSENVNVPEEEIYLAVQHVDLRKVVTVNKVKTLASKTYCWSQRARKVPTDRFKCDKYVSYFFLTHDEHILLARRAGDKEIVGFNYAAKANFALWDYGLAPRPNFRLHWLMRTLNLQNISAIALQLRVLYSSIRWDDLKVQPPLSGTNTITSESDVTTIELVAKRDLPPCGLRSEYKVRKIVVPLDIPTVSRRDSWTPARSGLRTRKKPEINDVEGPRLYEIWTPEEQLELWQIKQYHQNQQIAKQKEHNDAIRKKNEEARKLAQQQKVSLPTSVPIRVASTTQVTTPIRAATVTTSRPMAITGQIASHGTTFSLRTPNGQLLRLPSNFRPGVGTGQQIILKTVNGTTPVLMRATATIGNNTPRVIVGQSPRTINVVQAKTTMLRPTGILTSPMSGPTIVDSQGNPISAPKVQLIPIKSSDGKNYYLQVNSDSVQYVSQSNQLSVATKNDANKSSSITTATPTTTQQKVILKSSIMTTSIPTSTVLSNVSTIVTSIPSTSSTSTVVATTSIVSIETKESAPNVTNEESESDLDGKMVITTEMTQEIIRKALMNEGGNSAISQKLMALQKHHQDQKLEASGGGAHTHEEEDSSDPTYKQPRLNSTASLIKNSRKSRSNRSTKARYDSSDYVYNIPKSEKKERIARSSVTGPVEKENVEAICQSVLKNIIDQIQREEKRRKQDEIIEERKQKRIRQDRQKFVSIHTEVLRRYIIRQKAKLNLQIRQKIQADIFAQLNALKPKVEPKPVVTIALPLPSTPPPQQPVPVLSTPTVSIAAPQTKKTIATVKRKHNDENVNGNVTVESVLETPKVKRQKKSDGGSGGRGSSTTNGKTKSPELFCICRKPYDNRSFMVGCDSCPNWYHPPCIGKSKEDFSNRKLFTCPECVEKSTISDSIKPVSTSTPRKSKGRSRNSLINKEILPLSIEKNNNNEEEEGKMYCICNQSYDSAHFFICCDGCQGWFHGRCVGITEFEANSIEEYLCPQCAGDSSLNTLNQMSLSDSEFEQLSDILKAIQTNKDAWPFLRAVDKRHVPDYYDIIKEPMDLKKIETQITSRSYQKLGEFVYDMNKMFENCRLYNAKATVYYQMADKLEAFFLNKMKLFRENLTKN